MGKQARVADNATVVSTSTRNFPNRLQVEVWYHFNFPYGLVPELFIQPAQP